MKSLIAATIALCCLTSPSAARTIVVNYDHGGVFVDYLARAQQMRRDGDRVEIRNECDSSCTVYLGVPGTCVWKTAVFGFHRPRGSRYAESAAVNAAWTEWLWRQYPPVLRARLGSLTPNLRWLTGADLIAIGATQECP